MPLLRFIHAAGLDPDALLASPPIGLVDQVAAAPLAAIERLVSQAIEREADFLLLTPPPPADGLPEVPSVAGEAALKREFDRLFEQGIAVFLAVGSRSSGWERFAGRGSNVILLTPGDSAPVADRDGRSLGVLRCVEQPGPAASPGTGSEDLLELAIAPRLSSADLADLTVVKGHYVGLGAGPRTPLAPTGPFVHAPGPLQGRSLDETGPHGATFVTIDGGHVTAEFVPTASVRFESPTVPTEPNDEIEDIALRMAAWVERQKPEPGETAWIVRWNIDAPQRLCETLATASGRADLLGLLPDAIGDVPIAYEVADRPHAIWPALDDAFAAEFAAALKESESSLADAEGRLAIVRLAKDAPHRDRLARLFASADATAVLAGARRFGLAVTAAANEID